MTQQLFPKLQGLNWDYTKRQTWSNVIQTAASGKETRIKLWSYPKYEISISYDFLTNKAYKGTAVSGDFEKLSGFYSMMGGTYEDFLYEDPIDNEIETPQAIGIGDGILNSFQLVRTVEDWVEPIFAVKGTPTIYIDEVETTDFTLNEFGMITFTIPPVGVITWVGGYYFRCRFKEDNLEFNQLYKYFHIGTVNLITVKP